MIRLHYCVLKCWDTEVNGLLAARTLAYSKEFLNILFRSFPAASFTFCLTWFFCFFCHENFAWSFVLIGVCAVSRRIFRCPFHSRLHLVLSSSSFKSSSQPSKVVAIRPAGQIPTLTETTHRLCHKYSLCPVAETGNETATYYVCQFTVRGTRVQVRSTSLEYNTYVNTYIPIYCIPVQGSLWAGQDTTSLSKDNGHTVILLRWFVYFVYATRIVFNFSRWIHMIPWRALSYFTYYMQCTFF